MTGVSRGWTGATWRVRVYEALDRLILRNKLDGVVVLPGFHSDLEEYLPHFDLLVIPSFTEGLSNVALEAFAAGVQRAAWRKVE